MMLYDYLRTFFWLLFVVGGVAGLLFGLAWALARISRYEPVDEGRAFGGEYESK